MTDDELRASCDEAMLLSDGWRGHIIAKRLATACLALLDRVRDRDVAYGGLEDIVKETEKERDALAAEVERLKGLVDETGCTLDDEEAAHSETLDSWQAARTENAALRERLVKLAKYAEHPAPCCGAFSGHCVCGLAAVLKEVADDRS